MCVGCFVGRTAWTSEHWAALALRRACARDSWRGACSHAALHAALVLSVACVAPLVAAAAARWTRIARPRFPRPLHAALQRLQHARAGEPSVLHAIIACGSPCQKLAVGAVLPGDGRLLIVLWDRNPLSPPAHCVHHVRDLAAAREQSWCTHCLIVVSSGRHVFNEWLPRPRTYTPPFARNVEPRYQHIPELCSSVSESDVRDACIEVLPCFVWRGVRFHPSAICPTVVPSRMGLCYAAIGRQRICCCALLWQPIRSNSCRLPSLPDSCAKRGRPEDRVVSGI